MSLKLIKIFSILVQSLKENVCVLFGPTFPGSSLAFTVLFLFNKLTRITTLASAKCHNLPSTRLVGFLRTSLTYSLSRRNIQGIVAIARFFSNIGLRKVAVWDFITIINIYIQNGMVIVVVVAIAVAAQFFIFRAALPREF